MLVTLVALLVPVALGVAFVGLLWPPLRSHTVLKACLSIGLGFGVFSCLFFGQMVIGMRSGNSWLWTQAIALLLLVLLCYRNPRREAPVASSHQVDVEAKPQKLIRTMAVLFGLVLAADIASFVLNSMAHPLGETDAWMIWNVRARFLFMGGERWRDAFSPLLIHADYPLLIPAAVAGSWSNIGADSVLVPIGIAMLFTFATVGLVASTVTLLCSPTQGMLAGLTLLTTPYLIWHGANQYADVPLAFFFASTVALLMIHDHVAPGSRALILLAGFSAGLAAWTKNEGVLFVFALILTRLLTFCWRHGLQSSVRQMGSFFSGLVPVLLIVGYFKTQLAPPNDMVSADILGRTVPQLLQLTRYAQVWTAIAQKLSVFARGNLELLAIYGVLAGTAVAERDRSGLIAGFLMLSTVLAAHSLILVLTPYDLSWHLRTSLDRLLLQLWPSFVLLFFLTVRLPELAWARVATASQEGS
jgi:hypothetical protein